MLLPLKPGMRVSFMEEKYFIHPNTMLTGILQEPTQLVQPLSPKGDAPSHGYGNLSPAYAVPTWYLVRFAPRPSATSRNARRRLPGTLPAPTVTTPTLHLSITIFRKASRSTTEEEDSEKFSNYLWLFRTQMPVLRRPNLL
jgi:hypothetical protein